MIRLLDAGADVHGGFFCSSPAYFPSFAHKKKQKKKDLESEKCDTDSVTSSSIFPTLNSLSLSSVFSYSTPICFESLLRPLPFITSKSSGLGCHQPRGLTENFVSSTIPPLYCPSHVHVSIANSLHSLLFNTFSPLHIIKSLPYPFSPIISTFPPQIISSHSRHIDNTPSSSINSTSPHHTPSGSETISAISDILHYQPSGSQQSYESSPLSHSTPAVVAFVSSVGRNLRRDSNEGRSSLFPGTSRDPSFKASSSFKPDSISVSMKQNSAAELVDLGGNYLFSSLQAQKSPFFWPRFHYPTFDFPCDLFAKSSLLKSVFRSFKPSSKLHTTENILNATMEESSVSNNVFGIPFTTPLHIACAQGDPAAVLILLQYGASPYIYDRNGLLV
jgi:hypothetical protein